VSEDGFATRSSGHHVAQAGAYGVWITTRIAIMTTLVLPPIRFRR
jgi:hypothetical protein